MNGWIHVKQMTVVGCYDESREADVVGYLCRLNRIVYGGVIKRSVVMHLTVQSYNFAEVS